MYYDIKVFYLFVLSKWSNNDCYKDDMLTFWQEQYFCLTLSYICFKNITILCTIFMKAKSKHLHMCGTIMFMPIDSLKIVCRRPDEQFIFKMIFFCLSKT